MTLHSPRSWSRLERCDALSTEVLVSLVAASSSLTTAILTHLFTRRNQSAQTDHMAVETMETVVKSLRSELDRERAYRQELEQRVRHLETLINDLKRD